MGENEDLEPQGENSADGAVSEDVSEGVASSQDDIDALMGNTPSPQPSTESFEIQNDFSSPSMAGVEDRELDAVYDIPVQLSAVLGRAHMPVNQLLKLGRGAVIELDRRVGEAVDILVNNKLIARGEVVLVEDRLGITMTEIIKSDRA